MRLSCRMRSIISLTFNVSDLYPYKAGKEGARSDEQPEIQWQKQMPIAKKPQMERILDKRVSKKTRQKQYFEYLVKWKGHPEEDAIWEIEAEIQKHGQTVQEPMKVFKPRSMMQEHRP